MATLSTKITKHMPAVASYRERLLTLQGTWDTLSLLSHVSGDGTDIRETRRSFERLAEDLVVSLASETLKKTVVRLTALAQVSIDVLTRNLYERTADIGFLSSDEELRAYARDLPQLRSQAQTDNTGARTLRERTAQMQERLREYVQKYSVYRDVLLLSPAGEVLLQHDRAHPVSQSNDPLIQESTRTRAGYVETFRKSDLVAHEQRSLIYSYRVVEAGATLGVLCLCFRFEDELKAIFQRFREPQDWTTLVILDDTGRVLASSDTYQLPIDAVLPDTKSGVVRFAGREYLVVARPASPYQGYKGLGWFGCALIPLAQAFEQDAAEGENKQLPDDIKSVVRESETIFSTELRAIPRQAEQIQRELNRSVWNGNVRVAKGGASAGSFSKALLWEISNTGLRTKEVLEHTIADLHSTVVASIMNDCEFFASVATELLDRNLYERANDCRWWALNRTLLSALEPSSANPDTAAHDVLTSINQLYTVYHGIVLIDAQRRVVACSNPSHRSWVGKVIDDPWAFEALQLRDSQSYAVSKFEPSVFSGTQPTFTYAAAIRKEPRGAVLGAIGAVFDTTAQLQAMLRDALPRKESGEPMPGSIAAFVDSAGQVIAATAEFSSGEKLTLSSTQATRSAPAVHVRNDIIYAVGHARPRGYREYPGIGVAAVVLVPLGAAAATARSTVASRRLTPIRDAARSTRALDIATFHTGQQCFGVKTQYVAEVVDGHSLTAMPGGHVYYAGYLRYQGNPILVLDLARMLMLEMPHTSNKARDVLVLKLPDSDTTFGLVIEQLDGTHEVAPERIQALSGVSARAVGACAEHIIRPPQAEDPAILLLEPNNLLSALREAPAVSRQAPKTASAKVS